MFRTAALYAIRMYQKYVSPHKGFSCAYRTHAEGLSCSAYGYKAIARNGTWVGLRLLQRRMDLCAWHHHQHRSPSGVLGGYARYQRGFSDLGRDDCCSPSGVITDCGIAENCGCEACEIGACVAFFSTCSCGTCGGGRRREENRQRTRANRRGWPPSRIW